MSKIICDVCGTTFPDSADQCPICGCAKPENPQIIQENSPRTEKSTGTYTYVKGGRFSKANVKKRNKAASNTQEDYKPVSKNNNKGLVSAIILLLLAIVAVIFYIVLTYFAPVADGSKDTTAGTDALVQTTDTTPAQSTDTDLSCTELKLSVDTIELDEVGDSWLLNAIPVPENTTDTVSFASSDTNVATVTQEGRIEAVGPGEAVITVTCGSISVDCSVKCTIVSATTEPTETTAQTIDPSVGYSLFIDGISVDSRVYKNEVTIKTGDSFQLTLRTDDGNIMDVDWEVSAEDICTVDGNTITGAAGGNITVSVSVGEKNYTCKVHVIGPPPSDTDNDTETESNTDGKISLYINGASVESRRYKNDVTIAIGESFLLVLKDSQGKALDVQWSASEEGVCTIDGNTITGKSVGNITVSVTYEGTTYTCILHVKSASK